MIIDERENRQESALDIAKLIMSAGRTAPKARGIDIIEIATLAGQAKAKLAASLRDKANDGDRSFFLRDAANIEKADAVILIGTRPVPVGLDCGYCGFPTCEAKKKYPAVPCAINTTDVGIAIGSMCSAASEFKIDARVMFSAGYSSRGMELPESFKECVNVFALPLSISSKSPFFDRQPSR